MRTWLMVAATIALLAVASPPRFAHAADRPPPIPQLFLDGLFDIAQRVKSGEEPGHLTRQKLSLVGRDDLIVDQLYAPGIRPTCEPLERDGKLVNPVSEIASRTASSGRLVIVNEGHDDAQSRALILDLLSPFHELGFSIYAAETFFPSVGRKSPRWPLLADGFYSHEPTFGDIIRRARALKFAFVPYEIDGPRNAPEADVSARIAERESAQAQNIMERILAMPEARALIHVGYHHLLEEPIKTRSGAEERWMANRLKGASGIDPLTVDQTTFQSPVDHPVICALASDKDKKRALSADMAIGLPKPVMRRGRPEWRRARGQVDATVPVAARVPGLWSIVEARYADEPAEAVPADRILLAPGEDVPLLVKPGKYRVEAWTLERGWSEPVHIAVPKVRRSRSARGSSPSR